MREVSIEIANRRPIGIRESSVRPSSGLLECLADVGIGAHVRPRQRSDLNVRDAPDVLGIRLEKVLVGGKALDQALAVIEPVDADHERAGHQTVDHAVDDVRLHRGDRFGLERVDIDADREHVRAQYALADSNSIVRTDRFASKEMLDAGMESVQVVLGLKTHHIVVREIPQQLRVCRQHAQHFDVRKRDMQEESDRSVYAAFAQQPTEWNQVVIMHPNQVFGLKKRRELVSECAIDALIGIALIRRVAHASQEIVKQGPQQIVCIAVVIELVFRLPQLDRGVSHALSDVDVGIARLVLDRLAAPSEPQTAGALERAQDTDRQTAGSRSLAR